jgi:ABC-type multidrug transport system ATPase subunit
VQKKLERDISAAGESEAEAIISLKDAVVSYREDVALKGVSLEIARGELLGIMDPNSAGKTTILTLVNGLGKLLSGRVSVLGRDISRGCPASLRRRIGYVFHPALVIAFSKAALIHQPPTGGHWRNR